MKTFLFDVDGGTNSAKSWPGIRKDLIDIWRVEKYEDYKSAYAYLSTHVSSYQLAVLDTSTELQKQILDEIRLRNRHDVADQRDWGLLLTAMDTMMRSFRHLPINFIATAHEIQEMDGDTGRSVFRPSFQGAFAREYSKHFDVIGRYFLYDRQVKDETTGQLQFVVDRWMKFQRDATTHAKDRTNCLQMFEAPDHDGLFNRMLSALRGTNLNG